MGLRSILLVTLAIAALARPATANDNERVAEARAALAQDDCRTAVMLLERVSHAARAEPAWVYLAARSNACAGNDERALELFRAYDKAVPGEPQIREQIAALTYRIKYAWKPNFCPTLRLIVNDWQHNFANVRGRRRQGAFIGEGEAWEPKVDFKRPTFRADNPRPLELSIHPTDHRKSVAMVHLFVSADRSAAEEVMDSVKAEFEPCFSSGFRISASDIEKQGKESYRARPSDARFPAVYVLFSSGGRNHVSIYVRAYGELERLRAFDP